MLTVILSLVFFLAVILVLAALVTMSGRPLKGSCGGVGGEVCACESSGLPQGSCDEDEAEQELISITVGPPKS